MAGILKIIVLQLYVVFLYGKPIYRPGKFVYSSCTEDLLTCEPLNLTKARQEKSSLWPPGPYAILMPDDGCPESESHGWKKSMFKMKPSSEVQHRHLTFCVKIDRNLTLDKGKWMDGMYNIYMSGVTCPEGFADFNRTMAYETLTHFGPVPKSSTVDDSEMKSITFYMCGRNSTNTSSDDSDFGKADTQFLCKQFMENEDCARQIDHSATYRWETSDFSTGTLPARDPGDKNMVWYQCDLAQTLSVSKVVVYNVFTGWYIGCYYGNVKWNVLHLDARVCNVALAVVRNSRFVMKMRNVVLARFITLLGSQMLKRSSVSIRILISDLPYADICNEDLGMGDGSIQDFQITASSWLPQYMPSAARHWSVGWCASVNDHKPWILVDLIAVTRVEGLSIWTMERSQDTVFHNITGCLLFDLFYGFDIETLLMYSDMDFHAHERLVTDVQTFMLLNTIDARYVKLEIRNCVENNNRCLRFELHGCKLAGIPTLICQNEFDMFELDREIRTEGDPIIYKKTNMYENCSSLCIQNENCSIVSYGKDEYCIEYPSSNLGMWQISDTHTGKWSAKLCAKDHVELFPMLRSKSATLLNVQYIARDSIITSIGYPFSYGNDQAYAWIIKYPAKSYPQIVFTNLSLREIFNVSPFDPSSVVARYANMSYKQECYDYIQISEGMWIQHITPTHNGNIFVIETEEDTLSLAFYSCTLHKSVPDGRGFRAIVTGAKIPSCVSKAWANRAYDGRLVCQKPTMVMTSMSILNRPITVNVEEAWEIRVDQDAHYTVRLDIIDFYVMCPQVLEDIRSTFAVAEMAGERTFCNTDKPPDVIYSNTAIVTVKFQRKYNPKTVYIRTEGFRLRYSMRDHSLEKLIDYKHSETEVCSKTFGKCYHVHMSLKTWNQASEICRKCDQMLVSVQSEYELRFINYILRDHRYLIKSNKENADLHKGGFYSHIGLRHVNHRHGEKTYVWDNAAPATYFPWKLGHPAVGKDCTRTNFQFISNTTFESEECTTDISSYFVCQSSMKENENGEEGKEICKERDNSGDSADIVFMLGAGLFFDKAVDFLQKLVAFFNVGPRATQIAIVSYSDHIVEEVYLNGIKTNEEAQNKIREIEALGLGGEGTYLPLEKMRLDVFSLTNGARYNVPQIGVLLTNPSSNISLETLEQARLAKVAGIKLLAIILFKKWKNVRNDGLRKVVSKPIWENYIRRRHYAELDFNLAFEVHKKISNLVTSANNCKNVIWKNWELTENINETFFGSTCQTWTTLTSQAKNDFKTRFPNLLRPVEANNFCLDPDSSGILWCYTAGNGRHLWEPCFMQLSYTMNKSVISEHTEEESNCKVECEDDRRTKCNSGCNLCDGVFNSNDFSDETLCREKGHYLTSNEATNLTGKTPERLERGPYFLCSSKELISILAKCDNVIDCVNASDELNCSSLDNGFSENVFSCDDDDCQECDFTSDYTTTEEDLHEFRSCESGEYECENKQCIAMDKRCNANLDCIDGSDENQCDFCKGSFHCDYVKCIPLRLKCDTAKDCKDGTDENSCTPELLSSCDQWWEHGYHTSGYYVIDDISVYCDFTSIKESGKITMSLRNIDVAIDGDKGQMYTSSLSDKVLLFGSPKFRDLIYREGYSCFLEVKRTCQYPTMKSFIGGWTDNDLYQDCQCTVDTFKAEKPDQVRARNSSYLKPTNEYSFVRNKSFNCNWTERFEDSINKGHYNVTGAGNLSIHSRILKKEIPIQIVPEQIVCTYEYGNEMIDLVCAGEDMIIPPSAMCLYDFDSAGLMIGCRSGSHLQNCGSFTCPPNTVKCPGSYCIPLRFVCDGNVHCPGGEDEHECSCTDTSREVLIFVEDVSDYRESTTAAVKLADQFHTADSDIRLLHFKPTAPLKEYNFEHRLLEIREEQYSNYSFQSLDRTTNCRFKSMARNLLGQIQFTTNYTKGIVFIEDSFESSKVAKLMFSNLSKPGFMIYRVLNDSNFTVRHNQPGSYRFVKDVPIHRWNALFSIGYKRFPEICEAATEVPCSGGYRCASSKQCIPLDQVCDGIAQCLGKDDERLCDLFCPHNCTCIGYTVSCRAANLKYNDTKTLSLNTRIADMSKNPDLRDVLMNSSFRFSFMTKLNLSSCEITGVNKNGFSYLRNLRCLDIGYNRVKILPDSLFSHLEHLVFLNLDGNFELQEISSTAFRGLKSIRRLRITGTKLKRVSSFTFSYLTLQSINISFNGITEIEDYAFNGTSVEKIDFRGNNIFTVNRMMFDGVSLLVELHTPSFKFCCIRPCYVDESNCFPPKNEFSSCEDLMRHPVLQAVLWIVGITSLLGNLGSIVYRVVYDRERLKIGYGIFVTNLAGADFLMGVYLLMIAIVDSIYRNRYIFFDDTWRNSTWCVTAGILSTVSSEASVLFVCFITLDRLLVIKYPFGTRRFDPRTAFICCVMSWAVAFLIALIPVVFTGYFENRFYSRSAVCIALPLTRDKPPGWMYSVAIFVGLNFFTFMLVAFGQLSIFLELRKATAGIKKTHISRKRDLQVARNLIFVATTDFLCWFPIGLMGIMALNGYPIPGDVYAWTAVFILPLNSALNPVLYTLTAIIGKQSFNPNIEEQSRIDSQKEIASRILKNLELTRSVHIKSDMVRLGQRVNDLLEKNEPISTVTVVAIGMQLSRYLSNLHESSIGIEQLSTDTTYVKVSKKKKHRVHIVLDSKLSFSNDEKILQDNIYQLGVLLRRLIAKTNR